jgi:protein-L-isoaspartate(D-aspartate) O-methyltransferase
MSDYAARRTMMVDTQVRPSDVTRYPIIAAMLSVPREVYVPPSLRDVAYVGKNVDLAPGRVVLEARTLAKILDGLSVEPDELVLDIGCGLGYSTAVVARMAEAVVAVEEDETLAAEAQRALSGQGVDNAAVICAPLAEGSPRHAPFDVILIQGGVETVPQVLIDQLKEGGRIAAVFMEGALGVARIGYKSDGGVTWRFAFNAAAPVLPGFAKTQSFAF